MAKFTGYYNVGNNAYLIDDQHEYANKSAAIVDTMMKAALSLLTKADIELNTARSAEGVRRAIAHAQEATGIEYRLWLWRSYAHIRPEDCARSWCDDAFCTVKSHNKFNKEEARELLQWYESDLCPFS